MAHEVPRRAERQGRRHRRAGARLALAMAAHRHIDGQEQRRIAGGLGALDELADRVAVAEAVELEPVFFLGRRGDLLRASRSRRRSAYSGCRRPPRPARRRCRRSNATGRSCPWVPTRTASTDRCRRSAWRAWAPRRRSGRAAGTGSRRTRPRCGFSCGSPRRRHRHRPRSSPAARAAPLRASRPRSRA